MAEDNRLLISIALLERTVNQLKTDKREQLGRVTLQNIKQMVSQAVTNFVACEIKDMYINGYLLSVVDCIDAMLSNEEFTETDTEVKGIITKSIIDALENSYVAVGKYYTNHDFKYELRLEPILQRVVNNCLLAGYTFGLEY